MSNAEMQVSESSSLQPDPIGGKCVCDYKCVWL